VNASPGSVPHSAAAAARTELEEGGHNTASAKDSLAELETLLRLHEAERDRSRKELDELT
jgi:hypothetical protein